MARKSLCKPLPGLAPWIGGKRNLAKRLALVIDARRHTCYAEPFTGMGGVFFARTRRAKVEVLNDRNGEIVNLFRCIQRHEEALIEAVLALPFARAGFHAALDLPPAALTDIERAARFLFLQRGRWAGNPRNRSFCSGPQSKKALLADAWRTRIRAQRERLAGAVVENLDWTECLAHYDGPATLFYLDPPYWGHETLYGRGLFSRPDFERMAKVLNGLKGGFLLSLNDTPETRAIFRSFFVSHLATKYVDRHGRPKPVTELLVSSYRLDPSKFSPKS